MGIFWGKYDTFPGGEFESFPSEAHEAFVLLGETFYRSLGYSEGYDTFLYRLGKASCNIIEKFSAENKENLLRTIGKP